MSVVEALPVPVIAAVSGPALGGGCELVLACDLAVCSTEATFGQIEANGAWYRPSAGPGVLRAAWATNERAS